MARTPLFSALRRALRRAHAANLGMPAAAPGVGPSRRTFLGAAALAPLALACRPSTRRSSQPRIAIVGGGIGGLHCAYRLQAAGVTATVYEASTRTGGRMYTARDKLADGQLCELGGELIDSDHATMHALAKELDLTLDDRFENAEGLVADTFFFDGKLIDPAEIIAAFRPVAAKMSAATATMETGDEARAAVDRISISAWLQNEAGLAESSLLYRLLDVAYTIEFGLPTSEQSSLNLLDMIDFTTVAPFRIFGDSDERYHVHAGNDAIPGALAQRLGERIALGHMLTRVANADGGFTLGFRTDAGDIEVAADHVVLAMPLTMMRSVDTTALALPPERRTMIDQLGYGTNAKLMLQFTRRVWNELGAVGGAFSDAPPLQSTWDTTRGQAGASGVITNFTGGARGLAIGEGTAEERATEILPWLDAIYPGTAATYRAGSAMRMHWPTHAFTRGSYACYRPGQGDWAEPLAVRLGRLHFAGEHTSVDFQGYMEGAAESGARAAAEILGDLG